jgi:hypothetical protein
MPLEEASHERIADAVLAIFEVARHLMTEVSIAFDRDRQVVPAAGAGQRPAPRFRVSRTKLQCADARRVPVEDVSLAICDARFKMASAIVLCSSS